MTFILKPNRNKVDLRHTVTFDMATVRELLCSLSFVYFISCDIAAET